MGINRSTGGISPQYHVVFDDYFQTVRGATDRVNVDLTAIDWDHFITPANSELYFDETDVDHPPPPLHADWNPIVTEERTELLPSDRATSLDLTSSASRRSISSRSEGAVVSVGPTIAVSEGDPAPVVISEGDPTPLAPPSAIAEGDFPVAEPAAQPTVVPIPEDLPIQDPPPAAPPIIDDARNDARLHLRKSNRRRRKNQFVFNPDHLSEGDMDHPDFDQCFFSMDESVFHSKEKFTRADLDSYFLDGLNWESSVSALLANPSMRNEDSRRFFNDGFFFTFLAAL